MVGVPPRPSAAWVLDATPSAVPELRRRAAEFVSMASGSQEVTQAVALAVSETVTNAVVDAYDGEERRRVRVSCHGTTSASWWKWSTGGPGSGYAGTPPGSATGWPWWARRRTR